MVREDQLAGHLEPKPSRRIVSDHGCTQVSSMRPDRERSGERVFTARATLVRQLPLEPVAQLTAGHEFAFFTGKRCNR